MASRVDSDSSLSQALSAEAVRLVDKLCDEYEQAWRKGTPSLIEFVDRGPPTSRDYLLGELIGIELHYRRNSDGRPVTSADLLELYPSLAAALEKALADQTADDETICPGIDAARINDVKLVSDVVLASDANARGLHIRCPHCCEPVELLADTPEEEISCKTCGSAFSLIDSKSDTGTAPTLQELGRFELLARLGVGGFGTVWKARDTELDRVVALKIPRRGNLQPDEVDHFFREARAAAQLRHPNIVSVYEIGREDETIFIVSDYVEGVTLADWMAGARPSTKEVARLGAVVADALQHAHDHGVIHRDLKPSNIMIDDKGQPHIMDFGLAKRQAGEVTMTVEGQILGTAAYMSPEQAAGESHWTDSRTDIYALGVVLFQLATGELPFRGSHEMHLYRKQIEDAPELTKLNPHISQDFSTICLQCLERDPNRRYTKAGDVAAELRRYVRGEPILARPISRLARLWRWAKRKPALAAVSVLTMFIAVVGPIVAVTIAMQSSELQKQSAEQIKTIAQEQDARRELTKENLQLAQRLETLRGAVPGVESFAQGWQRQLIKHIISTHYAGRDSLLDSKKSSTSEQAKLHSAIGFMYAEVGRNALAIEHLQRAKRALSQLLQLHPDDPALLAGLAECSEAIAKVAKDETVASQAADEHLELRKQIAKGSSKNVPSLVDLLAAEWRATDLGNGSTELDKQVVAQLQIQKLLETQQKLIANWPQSPAEVYEAACRLTLRRPALLKANAADQENP